MSEPAPEFAGLQALGEKILQQLAEVSLRVEGLSQVTAQIQAGQTSQFQDIADDLQTIIGVIEEARPLLESGFAKWFARRRVLPQVPSGPPA